MDIPDGGDRRRDRAEPMRAMNAMLESRVRESPGQWFWVHKRWPD